MNIIKANGKVESFLPNKILNRIKKQGNNLNIDCDTLTQSVIAQIRDGITTNEIDEIIISEALSKIVLDSDYSFFAARIKMSKDFRKTNKNKFSFDINKDIKYDYLAYSTFIKTYQQGNETPQEMYARIADYFGEEVEEKQELFDMLISKQINFATPTTLNAGTGSETFISCDISMLSGDDLESIEDSLKEISKSSKNGAGIGMYIGNLRSSKSKVANEGFASGVVRFADMVQSKMRFYNQRGRRPGSAALYLPIYHKDIIPFLELRLNEGDERLRTRDIFTAVTINDFFMDALTNQKDFYLFCPYDLEKHNIRLYELSGQEATDAYNKAVELGIGEKINPLEIWQKMIASQVSTGTPYVTYIDNVNKTNMQQHLGNIKSSNLCNEVVLNALPDETGQCALGSIPLPYCKDIKKAAEVLCYNINRVIDRNKYPTERALKGGLNQRSVGIGVAGLAEYLYDRGLHFEHPDAPKEMKEVMKQIYEGAIKGSQRYYEDYGIQFKDYEKSDYATWNLHPCKYGIDIKDLDIDTSKPVCNTLFVALMPTASSSNLLSCTEGFEVPQSMMYVRKLDKGEFVVVQDTLVKELKAIGLWDKDMADMIIQAEGSIQNIAFIPKPIRDKYKTAYEVKQRHRIDMLAEAAPFIDQSYSFNTYYLDADFTKISSALIYAWQKGLKTGVYYTRTKKKKVGTESLYKRTTTIQKPKDGEDCLACSA
jgi:ribonucleoside-diphosphate reductase alpha subunit